MTISVRKYFILLVIVFLGVMHNGFSQPGCTDPNAANYNAGATLNDGSCTYLTTLYDPPVKVDPMNNLLIETSGLQWAGGSLWTFNDGGGAAAIYRVDTLTNTIFQTVNLTGATNVDWEDIAFDGTHFYVGDFGNSLTGGRSDLKIYKFALSAIPDYMSNPVVSIPADQIQIISFIYADQPQPPVSTGTNNSKFDCEAMIVSDGKIHLFTKNWTDNTTTHYEINGIDAGSYTANNIENLETGFLVTAADKVEGKKIILLLGYQITGLGNHFLQLLTDYDGTSFFSGNKRQINLPNALSMGQAEGITFKNNDYGYISNEKVTTPLGTVNNKLKSFNINSFIPPSLLPIQLIQFNVTDMNGSHKITWDFVSPVNDLTLQTSANGISFTNIKHMGTSKTSTIYQKPGQPITYYRLIWMDELRRSQYSPIIKLKSQQKDAIKIIGLSKTGHLNFILRGSNSQKVSFKLVSTDGKTLSTIPGRNYSPGLTTVGFGDMKVSQGLVYLTAVAEGLNYTSLVNIIN